MNEWKGPWRCKECGAVRTLLASWQKPQDCHFTSQGRECAGKMLPHDRRASDPEKQELWNAIDNYGEHRRGCHKVYRSDRGECACGLDALLRRIPEEKP